MAACRKSKKWLASWLSGGDQGLRLSAVAGRRFLDFLVCCFWVVSLFGDGRKVKAVSCERVWAGGRG